ncbi:hypothetical protein A176_006019 [Myxococcus hansupus]|uniref:Uncharacterized protein n=1 Tax=Pseudomyxococcus hansupus TaxID=1297742 RepID=A0A0H4XLH0_9BACT|nr:hypothetical protein [Myxococcus hansupus]AKQ69107.1 hypothetical protein A176_006019 [Myxococcus hansupus]
MFSIQAKIFATFIGVGLAIAALIGAYRWRSWKRQIKMWEDFAASRGWRFESQPGSLSYIGTLRLDGEHAGRSFTVETEHRTSGKRSHIVTLIRHDLGASFPREVSIRPEKLANKLGKLFGVRDEEIGDTQLDAALNLKNVTPRARDLLLGGRLHRPLLNIVRGFETFTIEDGKLTAEVMDVPRTTIELYTLLAPVRELADAIPSPHDASRENDTTPEAAGA